MSNKRTAAERAAIDARATAFPHPLSGPQITALLQMVGGPLTRTRDGWGLSDGVTFWPTPTIGALVKRGFAKFFSFETRVRVTAAGRRKAAGYR